MKLDPQVFRDAAESIASGEYMFCCNALPGGENYLSFFDQAMSDKSRPDEVWWDSDSYDEDREARILALLLCVEMIRDENRRGRKQS